jgi:hypothetical protein
VTASEASLDAPDTLDSREPSGATHWPARPGLGWIELPDGVPFRDRCAGCGTSSPSEVVTVRSMPRWNRLQATLLGAAVLGVLWAADVMPTIERLPLLTVTIVLAAVVVRLDAALRRLFARPTEVGVCLSCDSRERGRRWRQGVLDGVRLVSLVAVAVSICRWWSDGSRILHAAAWLGWWVAMGILELMLRATHGRPLRVERRDHKSWLRLDPAAADAAAGRT